MFHAENNGCSFYLSISKPSSLSLSIYPSFHLSICLSMCLSLNLSLSIDLWIYRSLYRSIFLSIQLSTYLSIHLSNYLSGPSIRITLHSPTCRCSQQTWKINKINQNKIPLYIYNYIYTPIWNLMAIRLLHTASNSVHSLLDGLS